MAVFWFKVGVQPILSRGQGMENSASQKYWQIAFIVGLVTCILAAFLVLGQTRVTVLVGVISLIIAVLNALLGARPSAPKDQTWLQTCLEKNVPRQSTAQGHHLPGLAQYGGFGRLRVACPPGGKQDHHPERSCVDGTRGLCRQCYGKTLSIWRKRNASKMPRVENLPFPKWISARNRNKLSG